MNLYLKILLAIVLTPLAFVALLFAIGFAVGLYCALTGAPLPAAFSTSITT